MSTKKTEIIPISDRVVIRPQAPESVSSGGLIIPDAGREKSLPGEVVAIGPGIYTNNGELIRTALKVGDTVLYSKGGSFNTINIDNEDLIIVRETELLTILR